MVDFGRDIQCVDDLDPGWTLVEGQTAVANALARRLGTPRGGLFYDETYGFDLRQFINADLADADLFAIAAGAEAECERDERVQRAGATVSLNTSSETLKVSLSIETAEGPFKLVLHVSAVSVEILSLTS